ncbi:aldehyde dehydrogenase family protein, partial [Kocuria sp. CPCC 205292]
MQTATQTTTRTVTHWINGELTAPGSDSRYADVTNPASGRVTSRVALAPTATVDEAVTAAATAFPSWRDTSIARRTQVIFAFRELLNARKGELAEIITAEHGKVLDDALGEVAR